MPQVVLSGKGSVQTLTDDNLKNRSFVSKRESEGLLSLLKTVLHADTSLLPVTARPQTSQSAALKAQDASSGSGIQ